MAVCSMTPQFTAAVHGAGSQAENEEHLSPRQREENEPLGGLMGKKLQASRITLILYSSSYLTAEPGGCEQNMGKIHLNFQSISMTFRNVPVGMQ